LLTCAGLWGILGDDAGAFLYGDDRIDGDVAEFVYLAAGPGDYERIDFGVQSVEFTLSATAAEEA